MAEKLATMPRRPGRAHPWKDWTDGSIWKIRRGEDFQSGLESMRTQLYGKARSMTPPMDVELVMDREAETITFRMTPKQEQAS
jgi:hypothetical protein